MRSIANKKMKKKVPVHTPFKVIIQKCGTDNLNGADYALPSLPGACMLPIGLVYTVAWGSCLMQFEPP